jgi:SAM-dependent methyltransferase
MERQAYKFLIAGESSWWYRARQRFIERSLGGVQKVEGPALDFGAGFGACHDLLAQYTNTVDAFEMDKEALEGCNKRGYRIVASVWEDMRGPYALVGAFDVIEHLEDDARWLRALYARTEEGGTLVISVPAFQFLWSEHDVLHKHFRRYTKKTIRHVLENAGFRVVRTTYWNFLLFPVALVLRFVGKGGGDALMPSSIVQTLLNFLLTVESKLVPTMSLPWGTGIIVVAQKPVPGTQQNVPRL